MKINPDCIRDILLYLENHLTYVHDQNDGIEHNYIGIRTLADKIHEKHKHSKEDVYYSVEKLLEARYISAMSMNLGSRNSILVCDIADITYEGHNFLNTIRPEKIWKATLKKAKQIGGMSIKTLSLVSSSIMQGMAGNTEFIQSIVDILK